MFWRKPKLDAKNVKGYVMMQDLYSEHEISPLVNVPVEIMDKRSNEIKVKFLLTTELLDDGRRFGTISTRWVDVTVYHLYYNTPDSISGAINDLYHRDSCNTHGIGVHFQRLDGIEKVIANQDSKIETATVDGINGRDHIDRRMNDLQRDMHQSEERIVELYDYSSANLKSLECHDASICELKTDIAELASRKQNTGWKQDHEPVDNDKVLEIEDRLNALIGIVDKMRKEKKPISDE